MFVTGYTRIRTIISILVFSVFLLISVYAQAKPKVYKLVCQGGGKMYAVINKLATRNRSNLQTLHVSFKHARYSARRATPRPGECAWVDRPMRKNEPWEFVYSRKFRAKSNPYRIYSVKVMKRQLRVTWYNAPRFRHLYLKVLNGRRFEVYVKYFSRNMLKVVSFGR